MKATTEVLANTKYFSSSFFKDLNGGKYGAYRSASKTIKVKGKFEEIYNYVEDNVHLWIGRVMPLDTAGLDSAMVERMVATADSAQKKAVVKEIGTKFCHYTAADQEGDAVDITIIKGFWFIKTKIIVKLVGYAGYCKQFLKIIEDKIKKQLEMQ
ncbi:MAG: hypothetical protein IKC58_04045 [Clostridia bacterium]|nr:hypothetical protein [Clostridia bacterium]MBR2985751.1 hypothetical protein [Clostridia bacterium]